MSTVYLLRHPETAANVGTPIVRGNLDVMPDPRGLQQAQALGKQFAGKPVRLVLSSPLTRAMTLAKAIAANTGAQVAPVNALKSWDRGQLSGKPEAEVRPLIEWFFTHPSVPVPGGESYEQFLDRWRQALLKILSLSKKTGIDIAVVTHAHNLNTAPAILTNGKAPIAVDSAPPPGSVLRLDSTAKGWKLAKGIGSATKLPAEPETPSVKMESDYAKGRKLKFAGAKPPIGSLRSRRAAARNQAPMDSLDQIGQSNVGLGATTPGNPTRGTIPTGFGGAVQRPENYGWAVAGRPRRMAVG